MRFCLSFTLKRKKTLAKTETFENARFLCEEVKRETSENRVSKKASNTVKTHRKLCFFE